MLLLAIQGFGQFQIPAGGGVHGHGVIEAFHHQPGHVGQFTALGFLGITEQRARSGHGHRSRFAEAGQVLHLELLTQLAAGGLPIKLPVRTFAAAGLLAPAAGQRLVFTIEQLRG